MAKGLARTGWRGLRLVAAVLAGTLAGGSVLTGTATATTATAIRATTAAGAGGSVLTGVTRASTTAATGDTGFYYGSDSNAPSAVGDAAPYSEPGTGGLYGGYVAEVGTWTDWTGCTSGIALDTTALNEANADSHVGDSPAPPGVFFYWFAAGPGAQPGYNPDASPATLADDATLWGEEQAEEAVAEYKALGLTSDSAYKPIMFIDIETQPLAGYANGWDEEVNSCGQITGDTTVPYQVDRDTFNGFWDYLAGHTTFEPGVYSTVDYWDETFGTGAAGTIPNTYEWTPITSTGAVTPDPDGFCQGSTCAEWFGGVSTAKEAGWQWAQVASGDYDQWDTAHLPGKVASTDLADHPANALRAGDELLAGDELIAGAEKLVLQATDGNLVLYRGSTAIWSALTQGNPGDRLVVQGGDGNIVLYKDGKALWNTKTEGHPGARLVLQGDNGPLVVYTKANDALWHTAV